MKPKTVKLQNYRSGRIIEAPSITEFCRLAGLKQIDKYHFTAILKGERLHHKGWQLPKNEEFLIFDIYGNEYHITNLLRFCHDHHLNTGKMHKLVKNEITNYNGLYMSGTKPPIFKPRKIYSYEFSNGDEKIKTNIIQKAAFQAGVSPSCLYSLISGRRSKLKTGWELIKVSSKDYTGKIL